MYDHYTIKVARKLDGNGSPERIEFSFHCRHDPASHKVQVRGRTATAHGTSNLGRTMLQCNRRRGVAQTQDSNANAQQTLDQSVSTYTPARHRAMIAMRCAASHRPFNSVTDPFYLEEVQMLRPGTKVPSPMTVSRDVQRIYAESSIRVKEYFQVRNISRYDNDEAYVLIILTRNLTTQYTLSLTDGRHLSSHRTWELLWYGVPRV